MAEKNHSGHVSAVSTSIKNNEYPVCGACGSDAVVKDAWASWNPQSQTWELKDVFDHTYCTACENEAKLVWKQQVEPRTEKICRLNDELRTGKNRNGEIMITSGIDALGSAFKTEVARAVSEFDAFTPDIDPHGEHDFGTLEVQGEKVFFKIDYYDLAMEAHSPDPSDPEVTKRVLTIMLANEY